MPPLENSLLRLAERHPPAGADHLIERLESRLAESARSSAAVLHAARVMALSALTVLVFVGGVVAGRWLLGPGAVLDFGFGRITAMTRTAADVSVLGAVVAAAAGGGVLLAGAAALAWTRYRRRVAVRALLERHRGGIMETIDTTAERSEISRQFPYRANRWPVVGLIVAVAALAAVGAWLLINNLVQTDYEVVVNDFYAAFDLGDGPGVATLFTEDGVFVDPNGREIAGRTDIALMVDALASGGFRIEITGETLTFGAFVAVPEHVLWGSQELEGISVAEFEGRLIKRWVVHASQVVSG